MRADEAYERRGDVTFLDVREPDEWEAGHIEGAVHIPMGELSARQDEIPAADTLVVVCRSGNRSSMVTGALQRAGYEAHNLDGGLASWAANDHPVVASDGGPGQVA